MKKIEFDIDKYKRIIDKPKKKFAPNTPEVNSMNEHASKMRQIDLQNRNEILPKVSNITYPVNGIDENSSVNVIVYVDQNAEKYFKYCEHTFVNWCNNKKYTLSVVRHENDLNLYITWKKIQLLRNALYRNTHDIVAIVDADIIINNSFLDIKQYLKPNKYMYASSDYGNGQSVINAGFMFMINNNYSKKLIDLVWKKRNSEYGFKLFHEQSVISILYTQGYFDIIEVLDTRSVNSCWLDDRHNRPDNNVYHFMGRSLEEKIHYVKSHFDIQD